MQSPTENRRWTLVTRPTDWEIAPHLKLETGPVPEPGPGEFLVRTVYLSLVPVMRMYMTTGAAGEPPVPPGGTIPGRGVGQVVKSRHPDFAEGDIVHAPLGWQDYRLLDGTRLTFKVRQRVAPISTAIGVLGITGFTAYFGLIDIAQPQPGETVLVSGAAGGVGSSVGQLAAIAGARAIGIAGGAEKTALLTERLGYHAALDYRDPDWAVALDALAPDGIDVFFDNVGGTTLDRALERLRRYGRITLCGRISEYADTGAPALHEMSRLNRQCARAQGFFIYDYAPRFPEAEAAMAGWVAEGRLTWMEDVLDGLERMPEALERLYKGLNRGKQIVRVAPEPER